MKFCICYGFGYVSGCVILGVVYDWVVMLMQWWRDCCSLFEVFLFVFFFVWFLRLVVSGGSGFCECEGGYLSEFCVCQV